MVPLQTPEQSRPCQRAKNKRRGHTSWREGASGETHARGRTCAKVSPSVVVDTRSEMDTSPENILQPASDARSAANSLESEASQGGSNRSQHQRHHFVQSPGVASERAAGGGATYASAPGPLISTP